jgi:hydrogenase maturation factor
VRGACVDVLHIANEGQFVAGVAADAAERALTALRTSGRRPARRLSVR